ncbi:MAG: 30S ribosomal protein S17 [Candidatus Moraniibacteriota bacterium]
MTQAPEEKVKVSKAPIQKGIVVSDRMAKTIVVAVDTLKTHPKYQKRYISTKKYKVHDAEGKYKVGDVVRFRECRPISKDKRHAVITE